MLECGECEGRSIAPLHSRSVRGGELNCRSSTPTFGSTTKLQHILLTWEQDGFAYAEGYDESASRYRGLRAGVQLPLTADDSGLLVRPDIARRQIDQETTPPGPTIPGPGPVTPTEATKPITRPSGQVQPPKPKRYHGSVILDSARVGRDAGRIADEVVTHLVGLAGSSVRVTLEIEADIPQGAPDNVVRIVTENSRTLKFASNSGFETE